MLVTLSATSAEELNTNDLSYMLGYDIGSRLKTLEVDVDQAVFAKAIKDALAGKDSELSEEQLATVQAAFSQHQQAVNAKLQEEQRAQLAEQSEKNKSEGEAYLVENGKREGVITTASGLQYEVLSTGDGARPVATDKVRVHYRGTLLDGTEFDSSYSRGQPASFGLNGVIPGWTEGVQLMPVGSKYKFHIPSELAYGGRNTGIIGPNSTLVFEVELLAIETAAE